MKDAPSIAKLWIATRIAEFPTLYSHSDQVIFSYVVGNMGSNSWDENGLLQSGDQHWDATTKQFGAYPLKISIEVALSMAHSFGKRISPYYDMSGPINNMPVNIDDSWLLEISMFLNRWAKFTMDDFKLMATMHCLLHYGMRENPNAGLPARTIADFEQFHKKIPSWQAMVSQIYYQKQYNKVNPATYQGIDI